MILKTIWFVENYFLLMNEVSIPALFLSDLK